jgi:hypothetical protein
MNINNTNQNSFRSNYSLVKSRNKLKIKSDNINMHKNLSLNTKYKINLKNHKSLFPKKLLFTLHKNLNKTENNLSYRHKDKNILIPFKLSEPKKNKTKSINYSNRAHINKNKKCFIDYDKIKSIINKEDNNTNSSLYKNLYIGYNKKGEFIDNETIKEYRKNLRLFSSINSRIFTSTLKDSKINKERGTLLSFNFNRDAYSNEQRLLYKNSFTNLNLKFELKNIKSGLKKQNTAINNYKVIINPNNIKNNKFHKSSKDYKIFKNRLFPKNINNLISINNDRLNLNNDLNKNNADEKKINEKKINDNNNDDELKERKIDKKEKLDLINDPRNIINYIYNQIKEFKTHQLLLKKDRKKGIRSKLENFKNDLKQLEKEAFFQLMNLKHERPLGNEINIKTSLFCSK